MGSCRCWLQADAGAFPFCLSRGGIEAEKESWRADQFGQHQPCHPAQIQGHIQDLPARESKDGHKEWHEKYQASRA
jgi:hypothetical protein